MNTTPGRVAESWVASPVAVTARHCTSRRRVTDLRSLLLLTALLATGCGGSKDVSPTPATSAAVHDTLLPAGANILTGTAARATQFDYSAPFDDFTPTTNATIRSVEWQGFYCNNIATTLPEPIATSFTIRLAPNEDGAQRPPFDGFRAPATTGAYQVTTVPASATRQRLEFTRADAGCGASQGAYYRYSADLSSPYAVSAATRYWIGIYPEMPPVQVSWNWRFGTQDNSYSINWIQGTLTLFFADRAFAVR